MTTAPALLDAERAWKALRRELITASDVAAIIGADERKGPLAVWCEKTGAIDQEETVPMRRGRRFEQAISEEYADQTGRPVTPWPKFEILRHPSMPWLGATLDLLTVLAGQKIPLEIKLAIGSATDWREEAPLAHQCQAQVQAQCFGSDVVALAGLVGPGPLATFDLERDDAFFAALVPELELFRWHVQTKKPPAADGKPATSWAVRRRWAVEDGQTIQLDQETLALVARWEEAKARERGANAAAETFENEIRARLGGASFGSLPDGSHMKLALVKREGYEVKPTSYRVLRRIYPRIRRADVK